MILKGHKYTYRVLYCKHGHYRTSQTIDKRGNCSICRDDRVSKWTKDYKIEYAAMQRKSVLKIKYGLTVAEYNQMKTFQNSRCAGCLQQPSKFVVDHSHATGKVRGLLCNGCNLALGSTKDSILILEGLIKYLKERG